MRSADRQTGFTLLELVVALSLFAIIVINVLADREKSIHMAADARVVQTVRYLAQSKVDEIKHDPEEYGDADSGDFEDLNTDWQDFTGYTWESKLERIVVVGSGEDSSDDYLFPEDEEEDGPVGDDGQALPARYVRRLTVTIRFEPDGLPRPDLSIRVVTFIPDAPEEEQNP